MGQLAKTRPAGQGDSGAASAYHEKMATHRARGFTLIELLVVVVIISLIAAVMIPALLRQMQRQRREAPAASPHLSQSAPSAIASVEGISGEPARLAHIESTDVRVDLRARQLLDGGAVHTEYDAAFVGTFTVRSGAPLAGVLSFRFPFPPGISEARDVSLRVQRPGGVLVDPAPEEVSYQRDGIRWTAQVPAGGRATVVVSYVAQGRDAFVYDAVGGGHARSGAVRFSLSYSGARPVVPPASLQPSEVAPGAMTWRFSDLISEKPIRVELPAGSSPLGRLILLCQLAGLAVLLFGAGFWYLSEGQRPGGLDHFRLGHFLLVALTYSLFFVVFAVVGYRGSLAAGLLLGAGTSLPLLLLHTSRTSGWPFALRRGLPLSIFSLSCVVLGVYLEEQRAYVLMGATVIIVAYATVTYRGWAAGRLAHRLAGLDEARRQGEAIEAEAGQLLVDHPGQPGAEELARAADQLGQRLGRLRALRQEGDPRSLGLALGEVMGLRWAIESTSERAAILRQGITRSKARAERMERAERCPACGAETGAAPFCAACGTRRPLRLACGCGQETRLPVHLFGKGWQGRALHCQACGERLALPEKPATADASPACAHRRRA